MNSSAIFQVANTSRPMGKLVFVPEFCRTVLFQARAPEIRDFSTECAKLENI